MQFRAFLDAYFSVIGDPESERLDKIYIDTHNRLQKEYNIALVETVIVWAIIVSTVVGAVVCLFNGQNLLATIFGGTTVIDFFGGVILWGPQKQLAAVSKRMTLLDLYLAIALLSLKNCMQRAPNEQLDCFKKVIDEFYNQVKDL